MSQLIVGASHWLRQYGIDMRAERTEELVQNIEHVSLDNYIRQLLPGRYIFSATLTWSLCMRRPMKFMKSISSVGSNWARRLDIKGGMRCVILGPVVAKIRAKAKRVYGQ